jgi:osmoprotectant transport system permease protein
MNRTGSRAWPYWAAAAALAALFALAIFRWSWLEGLALLVLPRKNVLVPRAPLYVLAGQHLLLAGASSALALLLAFVLGIAATRPAARELRALLVRLSSLAETFPSAAVLALSVPLLGYGFKPTFLALFLYGILPVLRNTIVGIEGVAPAVVEAALGMGFDRRRLLWRIQLPLALPVILAGVRISVVINISAATLGAAVGAGGFGVPIVSGLRSLDPVLILRGSIPVALLALTVDAAFRAVERSRLRRGC